MQVAAGKFQKAYQAFKVNVNEDNLEHLKIDHYQTLCTNLILKNIPKYIST